MALPWQPNVAKNKLRATDSDQRYALHVHATLCFVFFVLLPRCMECRRGLAMRIPSVCQMHG